MMPRCLPENRKRYGMAFEDSLVSTVRGLNKRKEIVREQSRILSAGFESRNPAQDFAAIISCHPYRRDFPGTLISVKVGAAVDADTTVREVYRPLRVMTKIR